YKEKRQAPRIITGCPLELSLPECKPVSASLYDISPDGLQAWISKTDANELYIERAGEKMYSTPGLEAGFNLDVHGQLHPIILNAKPIYVNDFLDNYFAIGMQTVFINNKDAEIINEYANSFQ